LVALSARDRSAGVSNFVSACFAAASPTEFPPGTAEAEPISRMAAPPNRSVTALSYKTLRTQRLSPVSWRGAAPRGGAAGDFDTAKPILDVAGKSVVHVEPHGAGQTVIAANQPIVAGTSR
jgi:hypothetical protein